MPVLEDPLGWFWQNEPPAVVVGLEQLGWMGWILVSGVFLVGFGVLFRLLLGLVWVGVLSGISGDEGEEEACGPVTSDAYTSRRRETLNHPGYLF